ncbi:hypothetical protein BDN72DRAFT_565403 [Pluteus cervinus]|uniref:Uncharacterized protein n=1 Tax=Pluteus cervinus TaxID=181527 RepID=A0ACD3BBZ9_9AGAR|nr:hypothetical protein BDN72DRAFT_565403 [Pluteus cervinus]
MSLIYQTCLHLHGHFDPSPGSSLAIFWVEAFIHSSPIVIFLVSSWRCWQGVGLRSTVSNPPLTFLFLRKLISTYPGLFVVLPII